MRTSSLTILALLAAASCVHAAAPMMWGAMDGSPFDIRRSYHKSQDALAAAAALKNHHHEPHMAVASDDDARSALLHTQHEHEKEGNARDFQSKNGLSIGNTALLAILHSLSKEHPDLSPTAAFHISIPHPTTQDGIKAHCRDLHFWDVPSDQDPILYHAGLTCQAILPDLASAHLYKSYHSQRIRKSPSLVDLLRPEALLSSLFGLFPAHRVHADVCTTLHLAHPSQDPHCSLAPEQAAHSKITEVRHHLNTHAKSDL